MSRRPRSIGGTTAAGLWCRSCDKSCPMDVPVMSFTSSGQRVLSPECVLCQTCVAGCPERALDLSLGLD